MKEIKQVIVVRSDLKMRRGKECAQVAHASLGVFTKGTPIIDNKMMIDLTDDMTMWFNQSFKKIVLSCNSEVELLKLYSFAILYKLPCCLITDNGDTEFKGVKTNTCIAIGPAKSEEIDKITGYLKLR